MKRWENGLDLICVEYTEETRTRYWDRIYFSFIHSHILRRLLCHIYIYLNELAEPRSLAAMCTHIVIIADAYPVWVIIWHIYPSFFAFMLIFLLYYLDTFYKSIWYYSLINRFTTQKWYRIHSGAWYRNRGVKWEYVNTQQAYYGHEDSIDK